MTKHLLNKSLEPDTILGTRIYVILFHPYKNPNKSVCIPIYR